MKSIIITVTLFRISMEVMHVQGQPADTIRLEAVIVSATRAEEREMAAIPLQSMEKTELDRLAGYTAADALKTFAGVNLKDYGGIGGLKTVSVRSLGANHTTVFLDGVPLIDMATGQTDLGKLLTGDAGNITLAVGQPGNGVYPARSYASANTVYIFPTEPKFDNKGLNLAAGSTMGSFGLKRPYAKIQTRLTCRAYGELSYQHTSAHGRYPYRFADAYKNDSVLLRNNGDISAHGLRMKYAALLRDSATLSLTAYIYRSERGLPGAFVLYNPSSTQRLWNRDILTALQFRQREEKLWQWQTNAHYSRSILRYLDPEFLNSKGKIDNTYLQQEYYLSQGFTTKVAPFLNLNMASDLSVNTLDANLYRYGKPVRVTSLTALGLNFSYRRAVATGTLLGTFVDSRNSQGVVATLTKAISPSLSVSYRMLNSPVVRWRFLYQDIFRMPTFMELYYTLVGYNTLKPEKARQFSSGITGYTQWGIFSLLSFKTDLYYNRVKDKIVAVPTKNLFVWSMSNIGIVDIRGLELQFYARVRPKSGFYGNVSGNYTLQYSTDNTTIGSPTFGHQVAYIPFEVLTGLFAFGYKSVTLSHQVQFTGYRYTLGENIGDNLLPSWLTYDITLLYERQVKDLVLQGKAGITNVFNQHYEVVRSFPMPGRGWAFSFTVNY